MKYQNLLIVLVISLLLTWCSQQKWENYVVNNTWTMIVNQLSDQEKIVNNFKEQWYIDDCYTNPIRNCFSFNSWVMLFKKIWNSGDIVISNAVDYSWDIYEKLSVQTWFLVYNDQWKLKLPKQVLWWWGLYNINDKILKVVWVYTPEYNIPIGADEIKITINSIISWSICNPYDLNYYDIAYYEKLKKNGEFSVSEKMINWINTVITYQKFCYSDDVVKKCIIPLKWIGNYCVIKNGKEYNVHVMLKNKNDVDSILSSFVLY